MMYNLLEVAKMLVEDSSRRFKNVQNPYWRLVLENGKLVWKSVTTIVPDVDFQFNEYTVEIMFKEEM